MTRSIDCSGGGGDGGEFSATAGDNISLTNGTVNADSSVGGGFGGLIEFDAGEDFLGGTLPGGTLTINAASLLMRGSATDTFGGDGGELDMLAAGNIKIFGAGMVMRADAATNFDGSGGTITIDSGDINPNKLGQFDGDLELDGIISMNSGSIGGDGGSLDLSAGHDLTFTADADCSGFDSGGDVTGTAGRAMTLNGVITSRGTSADGEGGFVDFETGLASDQGSTGNLLVQKNIVATSGASHGSGQSITLAGCGLTVAPFVKIDGTGGVNPVSNLPGGSDIELVSRRAMQLQHDSQYVAPPGGSNMTTHLPGVNPGHRRERRLQSEPHRQPDRERAVHQLSRLRRRGPAIRRDVRQRRRRRRLVLQRELHGLLVPDRHRDPDAHGLADADADPHRHAAADEDGDADGGSDRTDGDGQHADAGGDGDACRRDCHADPDPDRDAHGDPERDVHLDPDSHADGHADRRRGGRPLQVLQVREGGGYDGLRRAQRQPRRRDRNARSRG